MRTTQSITFRNTGLLTPPAEVEVFNLDADTEAYALLGQYRVGQLVSSQLLSGFSIPVKAIFDAGANVMALRTLLAG